MKSLQFKGYNTEVAKNQDQYNTVYAFKVNEPEGRLIMCLRPSFKEWIAILFKRKMWLSVLTFNQPLQPYKLQTNRPFKMTEGKRKNEKA
jgi:hypothetical protein